MDKSNNDVYERSGGDSAWQAWLDLCSVGRVKESNVSHADGLSAYISAAMKSQLARTGYASEEFDGDDPVSFFDSFFLLGSVRSETKNKKPLKRLLASKMAGGVPLKELVCGVLFSPQRGRIRDIVRDWIATVKGWKWHSILQEDGTRKVVREGASGAEDAREDSRAVCYSFGARLDAESFAVVVKKMMSAMEVAMNLEKKKIALLLYVTANDVSIDTPEVLEVLEMKKSTAYTQRTKCMKVAAEYLASNDVRTDDVAFAVRLMASCKDILGEELTVRLGR